MRGATHFALSCALTLVGCGSSKPGEASGDSEPSDPNARVGEFSVLLVGPKSDEEGQTKLVGRVADAPPALDVLWEKQQEASGCVLRTPRVPFCDPLCTGGAICVEDDVCKPSPKALNAGKLTVKGLRTASGDSEFTVEPVNNTYMPITRLAYPAFDAGDAIELRAAGGDLKGFTLTGKGIAPLELEGTDPRFPLKRGSGLKLSWKAPTGDVGTRIQVKLDISHHGGSKGVIECDVSDSGSLTIPASLTDALIDLGTAGFPTVIVTRSALSSTTTSAGRVDFKIYMYVEAGIDIEGNVSCDSENPCPNGSACDEELSLCR
jgi:hypothetical protein